MGNQTSSSKLDKVIEAMFEKLKYYVHLCTELETVNELQLEQIAFLKVKIARLERSSVNRLLER
jgi:hypothetical protein